EYLELVERYEVKTENPALLQLATTKHNEPLGRNAARLLLKQGGAPLAWQVINSRDTAATNHLLKSLSGVGSKESLDILQTVMLTQKYDTATRSRAASLLGKSGSGEDRVLELLKNKKVPKDLIPPVVASVSGAWRGSVRTEAASYLPNAPAMASKKMPTINELLALKPNAENGRTVFNRSCITCHQMRNEGFDFGPKLSEIGSKLPKESLLEAILYPSAGIAFGYEGWELKMKDGSTQTGIIASKTESDIDLKYPGGNKAHIKGSEVQSIKQLKESLMPSGLYQTMTTQELADLLEYLANAKKKQ
ncbi:MAG: c-type cytochrome, partial [Flavisolibacter sp.]|nr:c-type cytochrome [Flavisolibacter sp.]